jgi:hypothetical protein
MSETHGHGREGFETEDLSPRGVFFFMAGLALLGVVIYFILVGMYRLLDAYDRNHQPPMNPMAVKTGVDPQTMTFRDVTGKIEATFPKPVLEYNEKTQFTDEVEKQDQALASYDWVDQKNGVMRIPIERAMDLVVERGLPVLPQGAETSSVKAGAKGANSSSASKPGTSAPTTKKSPAR